MKTEPLISCIMPTYGRPSFIGESIAMFISQDYSNKELIILNDCPRQIFETSAPGVRIFNQNQRYPSLGEKRNAAIELAHGDVIAIWDDDDVHLPWRLSFSMCEMLRWNTEFYRPSEFWAYWGDLVLHDNQCVEYWVSHGLSMFTKSLWIKAGRYPCRDVGEDAEFFKRIHQVLSEEFIKFPIQKSERFYVMRGTSRYHHMSICGGIEPLDISPLNLVVAPSPIQDPILREACDHLRKCFLQRSAIEESKET